MKKILSVILTVLMMFSIGTTIVACKDDMDNDTSQTQELTDEQKIRNAVTTKASLQFLGSIIGGNKIKSSRAIITNLSWSGESKCTVSGVMQKTDIYGTVWKNNFDCVVTTSDGGETWEAGSFEYKSEYWSKN